MCPAAWTVWPRVRARSVTSGGGMGECLRKVISFSTLVMYCCKMGKTLLSLFQSFRGWFLEYCYWPQGNQRWILRVKGGETRGG